MSIPDWFRNDYREKNIEFRPCSGREVLDQIEALEKQIKEGASESDIQACLKLNPFLLSGAYRSGHGTYAFFEKRLGNMYVIDWVIANGHSGGFLWHLVELECPRSCPFNKDGCFSVATRKGIKQIKDWRSWIQQNIDVAQRPRSSKGEGMFDIRPRSPGIVVVGQSSNYRQREGYQRFNEYRKMEKEDTGIEIQSYENFLKSCKFRWTCAPYG